MNYKHVYIIESESACDLVDSRTEGEGLLRLQRLCDLKSVLRNVASSEEFRREVKIFGRSDCGVLHISCHGSVNGIGFTDGSKLPWDELYSILKPHIGGKMLFLSCCSPLSNGTLIELFRTSDFPPFIIAGSPVDIRWHQAFIAWSLIYAHLSSAEEFAQQLSRALASFALFTQTDFCAHVWAPRDGNTIDFDWTAKDCLEYEIEEINKQGGVSAMLESKQTMDSDPSRV